MGRKQGVFFVERYVYLDLVGPLDRDFRPGQVREEALHEAVVLAAAEVGHHVGVVAVVLHIVPQACIT